MDLSKIIEKIVSAEENKHFTNIINEAVEELHRKNISPWHYKPTDVPSTVDHLLSMPDKQRVKFLLWAMEPLDAFFTRKTDPDTEEEDMIRIFALRMLFIHVLESKFQLDEDDIELFTNCFSNYASSFTEDITSWPLDSFVSKIQKSFKEQLPERVRQSLITLKTKIEETTRNTKADIKLLTKIETLLLRFSDGKVSVKPTPALLEDKVATQTDSTVKMPPSNEASLKSRPIQTSLDPKIARIDFMFRSPSEMRWSYFRKHYFSDDFSSSVTKNLIWKFRDGKHETACIFLDGKWTALNSSEIIPDKSTIVSLWHPALASKDEILEWRRLLFVKKVSQPVKQAYRERYLLTDAEMKTRTYSNRMAGHILNQHWFSSLAKSRGWKYSLAGIYQGDTKNYFANIQFKEHNLKAEYWIFEGSQGLFDYHGILTYVETDRIQFLDLKTKKPVSLSSVPPLIFSEVMRDADLFINGSTIGNEPTWEGGDEKEMDEYWSAFAFGELTEITKTRKEVLEILLPELPIAPVVQVLGNFLVVKGKERTYKIHIGNTHILVEPNDMPLCIDADTAKQDWQKKVFLPFEDDMGLIVILNKAFLLADDDKINDRSILSQINAKY